MSYLILAFCLYSVHMYKIAASFLGILIALMLTANGVLAGAVGNLTSLPIIHLAGLIAVSFALFFVREEKSEEPVPFYLNAGGLIGVFLVLFNMRCFDSLGASMTLSLGIVGQVLGSLLADSTGFLGMKKYPFYRRKLIGLLFLFAGVMTMTESWQGDLLDIFLALISGALVILSMIFNSQLALRIGTFHGVRRNYLMGLLGSSAVLLIYSPDLSGAYGSLLSVNPLFIVGGGFIGVLVVAGSNRILPKIPTIYTTLLLFVGQAMAGILIDLLISGEFSVRKTAGVIIIALGLLVNIVLEKSSSFQGEMA